MNKEEAVEFLFVIAKEIKRSFESPVILLTFKDYGDCIFNSLVAMRKALLQNANPEQVLDIVNNFHLEWLQAVQDIECFKKRTKDTPRNRIIQSLDYTMDCVMKRHKYFQKFVDQYITTMTAEEKNRMQAEIEIVGDMRDVVNNALMQKQQCLQFQADQTDFYVIIMNEVDELLNWLDRLNDQLAIQFSKVLNYKIPLDVNDLVKTLQVIIEDVANFHNTEAENVKAKELPSNTMNLSSALSDNSVRGQEINKIIEKIKNLEDRINISKVQNSSAVMALEHKAMYLEERLQSLQNLKLSLNCLKSQSCAIQEDGTINEDELHIFNHMLPHPERCRLVEQLVKLWDGAIGGNRGQQSIISILSAADIKEVFSDDLGFFTVDKHGRKIYKIDNDDTMYQLNDQNELVPVNDDKHVYYYDECGRYYLNKIRERVYKAHENASEYLLHRAGFMLKISEIDEGIEYQYDNLGRYYFDKKGTRIYKDKNSEDEYIHDGLGNLVRIREQVSVYETCPPEPMVAEESHYLKATVGAALKKCLAEVVVVQPPDPIKYLTDCLEKYQLNKVNQQNWLRERAELLAESGRLKAEAPQPQQSYSYLDFEASTIDLNFTNYETSALDF